jgi:polysaccharide export outer membrane protein
MEFLMKWRNTVFTCMLVLLLFAPFSGKCLSETGYAIGPGDVLMISVWGDEDLTREVVVSPEGTVAFPLIGQVRAAGHSAADLRGFITERLADGYLVDPQVEVVVKEYRSQKVYVLGEVVRPGTYQLDSRASILEIISEAGGLAENAGDSAQIIRGGKDWSKDQPLRPNEEGVAQVIQVDLRGLLSGEVDSESLQVQHGDTLFVRKGEVFFIYGEVVQPGKYRWEKDLTVLKAVIISGGFTDIASKRRIKIRREDPEGDEKIRAKLDTPVEPGDTVIVPESFF